MEEIEVGEYVRTKEGFIGIFKKYAEEGIMQFCQMIQNSTLYTISTNSIVKHSKNIIDLIEVGDYVNGKYVFSIGTAIGNLPIVNHTDGTFTPSNMIKSIVTKEQFKSVEYEVK